jgi:pyruvate dehydrogenase E2 component (dihydrolipoamide acetyltransferase)
MSEFRMPSLGADMQYGTVIEWRIKPGDVVERGDIVAVVDTEKAAIEVEIFETGMVEELLVAEGTRVPVGTLLARVSPGSAAVGRTVTGAAPDSAGPEPNDVEKQLAEAPVAGEAAATSQPSAPTPPPIPASRERPAPPPAGLAEGRVRVSPAARELARQLGVELSRVTGTGRGGAIVRDDVLRTAEARADAAFPPVAREEATAEEQVRISPLARRVAEELHVDLAMVVGSGPGGAIGREDVEHAAAQAARAITKADAGVSATELGRELAMRRAIAAAVTRSKREIPHYYLGTRIDLKRSLQWLEETNRARSVQHRILPAALLLKSVALALRQYPELNGFWIDDEFRPGEGINPGVAIFLRGGGLISAAILAADTLPLMEAMHRLGDLVQRARSGGLRGSEVTTGTITITNLGDRGTETVFGVIYPPQVAIIGFGRIMEEPWAVDGMLTVRPIVHASLAADHRASDGHRGALFLNEIDRLLQNPEEL